MFIFIIACKKDKPQDNVSIESISDRNESIFSSNGLQILPELNNDIANYIDNIQTPELEIRVIKTLKPERIPTNTFSFIGYRGTSRTRITKNNLYYGFGFDEWMSEEYDVNLEYLNIVI